MNVEQTWKQMAEAAALAATGHWKALRGFAVDEFKRLSVAAAELEKDFLRDMAEAALERSAAARATAERRAKRRFQLAFKNLQLASEGLFIAAKADAKLAAEAAWNAAMGVLRGALNKAIGVPLL